MSEFRILFLEPQPCIRALKYAKALTSFLENRVSLCFGYTGYSLNTIYGYGDEYFERMVKLNINEVDRDLHRLIDAFNPTLIHSHNAPNTLTLSAINVSGDVPVIHDVHEVLSIHYSGFKANDNDETLSRYREEEKHSNEESDGRIFPTESIKRYIQKNYDTDAKNEMTFLNYVSESVMPKRFKEKYSEKDGEVHIVYIGCVTSIVKESHYDLREIFQDIAAHGMHIHIYPTSNVITQSNDAYKRLADSNKFIHFHDNTHRKRLLQEITQYDFGWAGFNGTKNHQHLDIAFPNKVIEYVVCGLPVLAFSHQTLIRRFVEKHGVGLVFDDVDTLEHFLRTENLSTIRENVLNSRRRFAIENHIERVVNFYEHIMEGIGGESFRDH